MTTCMLFVTQIGVCKEMRYDDVFMLQKVSPADVRNFNYVAGVVPLINKIILDVSINNILKYVAIV